VFRWTRSRVGNNDIQSNFWRLWVPFLRGPEVICHQLPRHALPGRRCSMASHAQRQCDSRRSGVRLKLLLYFVLVDQNRIASRLSQKVLVQVFRGTRPRVGNDGALSNFWRKWVPMLRRPEAVCHQQPRHPSPCCCRRMASHAQRQPDSRLCGFRLMSCICD
jgi:hypothetical protein